MILFLETNQHILEYSFSAEIFWLHGNKVSFSCMQLYFGVLLPLKVVIVLN